MIDSPGFRRWLRSPWAMFAVAVGLRLLVAYFLIPMRYTAENDHFSFGHEMGRVARSIALGEGFSSPLHEPTGPTAWVTPVWPYLLALVFRMFGVYSLTSLWSMLTLNAIFSALTCWPLIWMGRKYFGEAIGMAAGWSWVFFPYAIFVSANWIWDTTLTTLLLLYLLVLTLQLEEEPAPHRWYGYAALWGLAILTNPIVITVLPFWAAWLYLRLRHKPSWRLFPAASAAVLLLAILTPWFVRNAVVFHRWIPLRSNFWLEVRVRNSLLPGEAFPGPVASLGKSAGNGALRPPRRARLYGRRAQPSDCLRPSVSRHAGMAHVQTRRARLDGHLGPFTRLSARPHRRGAEHPIHGGGLVVGLPGASSGIPNQGALRLAAAAGSLCRFRCSTTSRKPACGIATRSIQCWFCSPWPGCSAASSSPDAAMAAYAQIA